MDAWELREAGRRNPCPKGERKPVSVVVHESIRRRFTTMDVEV